jgi:hypothetical protein
VAEGNGNGHGRIRFKFIDFDQIQPNTDQRYLIKNWIPRDGLTVVWGPPKCGKSFFVADMALHIALGWDYRGHRTKQGTVLYIACEGQSGFRNRVAAFRKEFIPEDNESIPFKLLPTRLDMAHDIDILIHDIIAQLGSAECSLIVIDTLNRSLSGSENSDEDMSAYIEACDKLRERFGCAVVIIHHCGIEGTRPRGHTSLQGAVDTQIAVKKDENNNVQAMIEYMKEGEEGAVLLSRLRAITVAEDEDGDDVTSCVIEPADTFEKPKAKPKVPASAKLSYDNLRKVIEQHGEPSPGGSHMPTFGQVAQIDLWRRMHYASLGADMNDASKRQDFHRNRQRLQNAGLCGIHEQWAWLI